MSDSSDSDSDSQLNQSQTFLSNKSRDSPSPASSSPTALLLIPRLNRPCSRRGAWKLLHTKADPAVTRFWSAGLPDVRPGVRLHILRPETGRTHQLRVALKALGAPILGDALYGDAADAGIEQRTYLHACALRINLSGLSPAEPPLQVVCPPADGELFLHPAFRQKLDDLLPASLEAELGAWLPHLPLLASSLRDSAGSDDNVVTCEGNDLHHQSQTEDSADEIYEEDEASWLA